MELYFLLAGQALCLFSLWAIARYDWVRLTRPAVRVDAEVTGYRSTWNEGARSYAPVYRFTSEGGEHEVVEAVYSGAQKPDLGTVVALRHPAGRPDLAHVPRPLMWLAVYGLLVFMDGMLLAKMMGWIGG
ncbi:DUF3592 domain-containing protein [Novosphingobium sp.]|uniref:DUF3592 domain-containing protein n=1 Tax=Novosphingobium sp. TaxID=1874826 RepID=UPI00261AFE8D|nr:DUF3592 domain-containing protein [Novosphingobium sp.]